MKSNGPYSSAARVGMGRAAAGAHSNIGYSLAASPALVSDGLSAIPRAARCYPPMQQGRIRLPLAPRTAEAITIDPRQAIEAAALAAFHEYLDQIATNFGVVERLDDIEGAHQLRNGVRRLRVAFSAFAPVLDGIEVARLDEEARWLDREIGKLRDLDVAADTVFRQAVSNPGESSLRDLGRRLAQMASERRQQLRTTLVRGRARGFLIDLSGLVSALSKEARPTVTTNVESVKVLAGDVIDLRWKALRACAHRLEGHDAGQRHKLRKQIRNLRYALHLFQSLFPAGRAEPLSRGLKDLQTSLGHLSDAEMMKRRLRGIEETGPGDREMERAIGEVTRANTLKAERGLITARAMWSDMADASPFWQRSS